MKNPSLFAFPFSMVDKNVAMVTHKGHVHMLWNVCQIYLTYCLYVYKLNLCMRKPTIWVLTMSDTNWAVQSQKMDRGWKFWI